MTGFETFEEDLPARKCSLTNKKISDKECKPVCKVWKTFQIKMIIIKTCT